MEEEREIGCRGGELPQDISGRSWLRIPQAVLFVFLGAFLYVVTPEAGTNHFNGPMLVAQRMLDGKAYLPESITWMETFRYEGRQYLSYPPMVTLLLLPYAASGGGGLGQATFNSLLIFWSSLLLFGLLRGSPGMNRLAGVGSLVYVIGTPMIYSAHNGNVWLLMHSEGNFFLLLAIFLAAVKRRFFWAGLAYMVAAQVRYAILFSAPAFFLLAVADCAGDRNSELAGSPSGGPNLFTRRLTFVPLLLEAFRDWLGLRACVLWEHLPQEGKWALVRQRFAAFTFGASIPLAIVLAHQWWLFDNPLLLPYKATWNQWGRTGADFSFHYLWPNLKFYMTATPRFSWRFPYLEFGLGGQSIWFMSPFFVGIFFLNWRLPLVRSLCSGAVPMFVFYLLYWWQGYAQYGARYMQDLYPLIIPVALSGYSRPGRGWRTLLYLLASLAVFINIYGLWVVIRYPPG